MIMRDGRRWSNWVDLEKDGFFHTVTPNPWEDIEAITQFLFKSKKLAQYYRLLKVQADLQDASGPARCKWTCKMQVLGLCSIEGF